MPVRNLTIVMMAVVFSWICHQKAQRSRYADTITEAVHTIETRYVDEVDPRRLFENAMNGMVQGLDPYSGFIKPDRYRQLQESMDQRFGGIGIMVEGPPRVPRMTVATPLVGTPAFRAGLQAGDVILEIDGTSTAGLQLEDAVKLMRGEVGSPVTLLIQHPQDEQPKSLTIHREEIPIESIHGDRRRPDGSWEFILDQDPRIGYIRMTSFGDQTVRELTEALKFSGHEVRGLILDLRGNAGGLLNAAVETCDLFIDEGAIVKTRGRGGVIEQEFFATKGVGIDPRIPMVVLINRDSASASEIVAACLQDHQRAVVVGERSFGKGTVQNILVLEGGRSALKLTTARYLRPSGTNIHRLEDAADTDEWGVRPDEGFEVKLDDQEFQKVRNQRRERDLMSGIDEPLPDDSPLDINDAPEVIPDPIPSDSPTTKPSSSPESSTDTPDNTREREPDLPPQLDAGSPPEPTSPGETSESIPIDDGPVEDRQLQRAIDYLQEQIELHHAKIRAA